MTMLAPAEAIAATEDSPVGTRASALSTTGFPLSRPFFRPNAVVLTRSNREDTAPHIFGFKFIDREPRTVAFPIGKYDDDSQTYELVPDEQLPRMSPAHSVDTFSHITEYVTNPGSDGVRDTVWDYECDR